MKPREISGRVKKHVKEHREVYIIGAACLSAGFLAGKTWPIVRGVDYQPISRGISVAADRGISVVGKRVSMNNVSYISSNRQGPPSWVVRCLDNGVIFTSQRSAAIEMELPENEISKHLNGLMENVRGYRFERICLAA